MALRWWLDEIVSLMAKVGLVRIQTLRADQPLPAKALGWGVDLVVPASWVLMTELVLPEAVRANLPNTIAVEMDRVTPFEVTQVLYRYHVLRRQQGQIVVALAVLPKSRVQPILDHLTKSSVSVRKITLDQSPEWLTRLDHGLRDSWPVSPPVLVLLLLMLLAPMSVEQSWDGRGTKGVVDARISQILVDLSAALPAGAHLDQFSWDGKTLHLAGQAASTDLVIKSLAASRHFVAPEKAGDGPNGFEVTSGYEGAER